MDYFVTEQLSQHQGKTPEGFLVVRDVPLARTGFQLYSQDEVKLQGDARGHVVVDREPDEVFHPVMIASLNGMPLTVDHPLDDVTPANWKEHAVGTVMKVHRGEGVLDNLLIGDIVVYDQAAIDAITAGKLREVSVGYTADYEQTGDGRGRQKNIRANHLALVDQGRCGPVCRIHDHRTVDRDTCPRCGEEACGGSCEVPTTPAPVRRRVVDRALRVTRARRLTRLSQARNHVYIHYN
jgi:uncharacterized protein